MRDGRIIQYGPPTEVYREPASDWVARFVGEAVLLPARLDGDAADTALGRLPLRAATLPAAGDGTVLLRPEQMAVTLGVANGHGGVSATVVRHDFHGHDALIGLRLADGTQVTARILDSTPPLTTGDEVVITVRGEAHALM
jgi:iron(III) transport system ATP-binding protein